ncbi:MAG: lamin tail domain-containing protein, partial [Anaerolineae bacterium]|nr:lamin tail domain-containing protein [Anaerolineae bacterium]
PWSGYQPFSVTVGVASLRRPVEGETLANGSVIFEWSPIIGGNTFRLQIATRPEFSDPLIFDADVPAGTSFTIAPPLDDGTYYWRVRGTDSTLFSRVGTFIVDSTAPIVDLSAGNGAVSPADGSNQPNQQVTLSWPALPEIDEYQVQVDTSENFAGLLYLDRVFLDRVFLDRVFLDRVFLDRVFLDRVFLDRVFLDRVFLDRVFLDRVFLDRVFLDRVFLDRVFLDRFSLDKVFLDRVFLDRLLFDKVTATGGTVNLTLAPNTAEQRLSEGAHYWRVRARLADGSFGPWSVGRKFEVRTQPTKVVINEIKLTDPSWVEFHNTGTQAASMTNWKFFAYGPDGATQLLYTFPDNFTLPPNGYVVLYEGQGTDTGQTLFTGGAQIDWPLTAQTALDDPNLLNQMGAVVPAPESITSSSSASEPEPPPIIVGPNGPLLLQGDLLTPLNVPQANATSAVKPGISVPATPEASVSAQTVTGDDQVGVLTNFNIAIGDTISDGVPAAGAGNIESAGSNDTYTFPVTAGQIVYFDYISTSNFSLDWQLRSPSNTLIFNNTISTEVGRRTLTETGNYVLTVQDNSSTATGTYSFKIWGVTDNSFPIVVGDTVSNGVPGAGAGNIEVPGANDVYTFSAAAGDILYFDALSTSASLYLTLTSPSSAAVFTSVYLGGDAGRRTLTETGTYTLTAAAFNATSATTGTYSFKLWAVPVTPPFGILVGDTVSDGVPGAGAGNIETPGVQDVYTFDATAGDIVYFDALNTSSSLYLTLTSPTTVSVFSNIYLGGDAGRRVLTETGTYTLTVAAFSATSSAVGTYSFKLWPVAAPDEFDIAVGDTISDGIPGAGAGNIESPGARDVYTFSASAGDIVFFDSLGASDFIYARLTAPSTTQIFNTYNDAGRFVLNETGTYTLTFGGFNDSDDVSGTYSYKLSPVAAPQNFAISVGDTVSDGVPGAGAGNIESPGARDIYTFSATAGDIVYFDNIGATDSIYWQLTSPTSIQIFNTSGDGGLRTLAETGTYTLTLGGVADYDDVSGTYSFKLWVVPDPDEFTNVIGDTVSDGVPEAGAGNIEVPGATDIYTFEATAGQQVYFD